MSVKGLEIQERDLEILRLVHRFRFCLGRHIRVLCGFGSQSACDRRLRLILDAGYLERKKILYGVPYIYTLTHKGRILLGVNKRKDKIRIERITHDIYVLDAVIFICLKYGLTVTAIESEKELCIKEGFGIRKHYPDFIFSSADESIAISEPMMPLFSGTNTILRLLNKSSSRNFGSACPKTFLSPGRNRN